MSVFAAPLPSFSPASQPFLISPPELAFFLTLSGESLSGNKPQALLAFLPLPLQRFSLPVTAIGGPAIFLPFVLCEFLCVRISPDPVSRKVATTFAVLRVPLSLIQYPIKIVFFKTSLKIFLPLCIGLFSCVAFESSVHCHLLKPFSFLRSFVMILILYLSFLFLFFFFLDARLAGDPVTLLRGPSSGSPFDLSCFHPILCMSYSFSFDIRFPTALFLCTSRFTVEVPCSTIFPGGRVRSLSAPLPPPQPRPRLYPTSLIYFRGARDIRLYRLLFSSLHADCFLLFL